MQQNQTILKRKKIIITRKAKLHHDSMVYYVCRKTFTQKLAKDKYYHKVRDHCHFVYNIEMQYIKYVM